MSEYVRGWNDGLKQAAMILETDEALSCVSHKAIRLALEALKRPAAPPSGAAPSEVKP